MIAPFWHDFDLSRGGNIYYRQTADSHAIQSLNTLLLNNSLSLNNITMTNMIIATWDRVPPFGFQSSYLLNILQVVLQLEMEPLYHMQPSFMVIFSGVKVHRLDLMLVMALCTLPYLVHYHLQP